MDRSSLDAVLKNPVEARQARRRAVIDEA